MAAVAMLDLLRKNPNFGRQAFSSRGLFSQKLVGASTASAASFAVSVPFAFGSLFGNGDTHYAYCDAGAALNGDYTSNYETISRNLFRKNALTYSYSTKQYYIELKAMFSAFQWKNLALTSLRSFLCFYLPVLRALTEDNEDDDFLPDNTGKNRIDLVVPFKKSVIDIIRETTIVTTTRILERVALHYVSRRVAWKLIKDVRMSAMRKARRGLPVSTYIFNVTKTTCRGHFLGVLASWVVQVGIDSYAFFIRVFKKRERVETAKQVRVLTKRVCGTTIRCGAALVFASIGGGIGATIVSPAAGQFIGCGIGDLAGPVIVDFCFKKLGLDL